MEAVGGWDGMLIVKRLDVYEDYKEATLGVALVNHFDRCTDVCAISRSWSYGLVSGLLEPWL